MADLQGKRALRYSRLQRLLDRQSWIPLGELSAAAWPVDGEPVPAEVALAADYRPVYPGYRWGGAWATTWFRFTGRLPDGWEPGNGAVRLNLGFADPSTFGAEGLVYEGGLARQGIAACRQLYRPRLARAAGDDLVLHVEAAANPGVPDGGFTASEWLEVRPGDGEPLTFAGATLLACRSDVHRLATDFAAVVGLADAVGSGDPLGARLSALLDRVVAALSLDDLAGTATDAIELLEAAFLDTPRNTGHTVTAVGHAHLDTAWLWPVREARRKAARTFANALRSMEDHPDFHFLASSPQQYDWVRRDHPALFEEIRQRVADGRFEPVGGMWVEADCNLPSGESLVRQLVAGKRFFLEQFGRDVGEVWLPDVFGYPASLPQIMSQAGCTRFVTQKLSWNDTTRFPHHSFWWEGIDGTRVFAHFPPADTYVGEFTAAELLGSERRFAQHGRSDHSLYLFGYGDGGGGPTERMLGLAERYRRLPGLPEVRLRPASAFFADAVAGARDLPVWVGELYAEFHRGTLTSQAALKRGNRRAESLLYAAELFCSFAPPPYPAEALEEAWRLLLVQQFHDILPGSSIGWVNEEARRDQQRVGATALAMLHRATAALAADVNTDAFTDPLVVFNPTGFPRRDTLVLPEGGPPGEQVEWLCDGQVSTRVQKLHDGKRVVRVNTPPCGYTTYGTATVPAGTPDGEAAVTVDGNSMSNGLLRVEWDPDGNLVSVLDLRHDREVLASGEMGNVLELFEDHPVRFDAWDIDAEHADRGRQLLDAAEVSLTDAGPVRATLSVLRRIGGSTLRQRISLDCGDPFVRFETEADWQEAHRLLRTRFPVAVRNTHARYEIQFGHVNRATHRNTPADQARFESCAHRWVDLSEAGYGVALLNDCKYGHDVTGSDLRLTLLRGSRAPDPRADIGRHEFTYLLYPHAGDLAASRVVALAAALNNPLLPVPTESRGGPRPVSASLVEVTGGDVEITAVKRTARPGEVAVRLYETAGGRADVALRAQVPIIAAATADLLERADHPLPVESGAVRLRLGPFGIRTLLLTIGEHATTTAQEGMR